MVAQPNFGGVLSVTIAPVYSQTASALSTGGTNPTIPLAVTTGLTQGMTINGSGNAPTAYNGTFLIMNVNPGVSIQLVSATLMTPMTTKGTWSTSQGGTGCSGGVGNPVSWSAFASGGQFPVAYAATGSGPGQVNSSGVFTPGTIVQQKMGGGYPLPVYPTSLPPTVTFPGCGTNQPSYSVQTANALIYLGDSMPNALQSGKESFSAQLDHVTIDGASINPTVGGVVWGSNEQGKLINVNIEDIGGIGLDIENRFTHSSVVEKVSVGSCLTSGTNPCAVGTGTEPVHIENTYISMYDVLANAFNSQAIQGSTASASCTAMSSPAHVVFTSSTGGYTMPTGVAGTLAGLTYLNLSSTGVDAFNRTAKVLSVVPGPPTVITVQFQPGSSCTGSLGTTPTLAIAPTNAFHICSGDGCNNAGTGNGKDTTVMLSFPHAEVAGNGWLLEETATTSLGSATKVTLLSPNCDGADVAVCANISATNPPSTVTILGMTSNSQQSTTTSVLISDGISGATLQGGTLSAYFGGTQPAIANALVVNCALTSGTTCVNVGETMAATTANAVEQQVTTLNGSTAIPLQITQGSGVPATNAPLALSVAGGKGGASGGSTSPGNVGGGIALTTGNGSAGGSSSGSGGAGGPLNLTAGDGGAASAGSTTGAGGDIILTPGQSGGTPGTFGRAGQVQVACRSQRAANTMPCLSITGTWNTTGVVDAAIFENITTMNEGPGSLLMDLQSSGGSRFSVDYTGVVTAAGSLRSTGNAGPGRVVLTQGADAGAEAANTATVEAPASVTAYRVQLPAAGPVNNNSVMEFSSTTPGVGTFAKTPQMAILSTAYTNATATLTNVTGLSFAIDANSKYVMTCYLSYKGTPTGAPGLQLALTGPASPTTVTYSLNETLTSGAATFYSASNTGNVFGVVLGSSSVASTGTDMPAMLTLGLVNGANAGTVQLQAKSSAAGTGISVTIEAGSFCTLQ